MDTPKLPIKDMNEESKKKVREFLEHAKEQDLLDCIVLGSAPGNTYYFGMSDCKDRIQLLGYIFLSALELFHNIKHGGGGDGKESG